AATGGEGGFGLDCDEVPGEGPGPKIRDSERLGDGYSASPEQRTDCRPPAEPALRVSKNVPASQVRICGRSGAWADTHYRNCGQCDAGSSRYTCRTSAGAVPNPR